MTPPAPVHDQHLQSKLADRFPLELYLTVLDGVLTRLNDDLMGMMTGSSGDNVHERAARRSIYDHMFAARSEVVDAVGHLQRIRDPQLKFTLGRIVMTDGVRDLVGEQTARNLVWGKHARGNWGDVDVMQRHANEAALRSGARVVSQYRTRLGEEVYVITEADRSTTTVLMKSEY